MAEHARDYLVVSALGVPAVLLMLAATGALRGVLDLRTPLVATIVANIVNVVLNLLLVYGFDLGVQGAALGTVIAQWLAAAWLVAVVVRRATNADASTRPHVGEIMTAAAQGVPLIVRTLTLRATIILAALVAAGLGDVQLAAHQVAATIVALLAFGLDAIAIAGQTLTGRTLGSGDAAGTRALTRRMIGWGLGTGLVAAAVLATLAPWIPQLFTSDPAVRDALVPALLVIAAIQPLSGVVFVLDGVLIGAGDGVYLAVAGFATLGVYTPLVLLVGSKGAGFTWLWLAYGGFIAARLSTLWLRQRATPGWSSVPPVRQTDRVVDHEYAPGRQVLVRGIPERGVVLLWHGRGVDSASWMLPLADRVAERGSLALAPDWTSESVDGGRSDLLNSVRYARERASEACLDPDRIVLAGWSLGGTAAASLAVHAKRLGVGLGGVVLIAPADGPGVIDGISGGPLPRTLPPGEGRCRVDVLYGEDDTSTPPDQVCGLELRLRAAAWSTSLLAVAADHGEIVGCRYDARREIYRPSTAPRALAAADVVADVIGQAVSQSASRPS